MYEILISKPSSLVPSQKWCAPCLTFCHTVNLVSSLALPATAFSVDADSTADDATSVSGDSTGASSFCACCGALLVLLLVLAALELELTSFLEFLGLSGSAVSSGFLASSTLNPGGGGAAGGPAEGVDVCVEMSLLAASNRRDTPPRGTR